MTGMNQPLYSDSFNTVGMLYFRQKPNVPASGNQPAAIAAREKSDAELESKAAVWVASLNLNDASKEAR